MTDYRVNVIVDPANARRGTRQVEDGLNRVGNAAERTRRLIAGAFAFGGIGLGISSLVRLGDQFVTLQNRIRTVTDGTDQLAVVQQELFRIANRTRGPVEELTNLYQRGATAAAELGASQAELLRFTEIVSTGLAVQGGAAAESAGALRQLSQSLSSGIVRAEEFNSILEGAFPIAQAAARGIDRAGGSVGKLRQLVVDGEVSSREFFEAILSQGEALDETFGRTVPTISQAFNVLNNRLIELVGQVQEGTGVFSILARGVLFVAENIETLLRGVGALAIAFGIKLAVQGIGAAILGIRALGVAVAANPLGALLTALTLGISGLIAFGDQIRISGSDAATVFDVLAVIFEDLQSAFLDGFNFLTGLFSGFQTDVDNLTIADFVRNFARGLDVISAFFVATFKFIENLVINSVNRLGQIVSDTLNGLVGFGENFVTGLNVIGTTISGKEVTADVIADFGVDFVPRFAATGKTASEAFDEALANGLSNLKALEFVNGIIDRSNARAVARANEEAEAARRLAAAREDLNKKTEAAAQGGEGEGIKGLDERNAILEREIQNLTREAELLELVGDARQVQIGKLQLEEQIRTALRQANKDLSEEEINNLARLTDAEAERFAAVQSGLLQAQRRAELEEQLNGTLREQELRLVAANELLAQKRITQEQYAIVAREAAIAQREFNVQAGSGTFADGFILSLDRMSGRIRSFASEAGGIFGNFFDNVGKGFADSIGRGIFDVENLGEALKGVARDAISSLISSLIQLGIQFLANQVLAATLGTAATAAGVAQATVLASAYAPAAAFASLASFGANAVPASAGILSTVGLAETLAAVGSGFARGADFITGQGSSQSDSVLAALSVGEGVVTAAANRRNSGAVGFMNRGGEVEPAGASKRPVNVTFNFPNGDADSFKRNRRAVIRDTQKALDSL